MKYKLSIVPLLFILAACSGLGLQKAESFEDRVGYAVGVHTAVLQTTTRALEFKDIDVKQAESVADIADQARTLIDTALVIKASGDVAGADRTLAMAVRVLQELQTYLRGEVK